MVLIFGLSKLLQKISLVKIQLTFQVHDVTGSLFISFTATKAQPEPLGKAVLILLTVGGKDFVVVLPACIPIFEKILKNKPVTKSQNCDSTYMTYLEQSESDTKQNGGAGDGCGGGVSV